MKFIIYFCLFIVAFCKFTTPIICMHGLNCTVSDCYTLQKIIEIEHNNQPFFALDINNNYDSFKNLYLQIQDIQNEIRKIIKNNIQLFSNGFHFVGHSQGALLARSVIEESSDFIIKNFISLAGVQNGEYGNCDKFVSGLNCSDITDILYSWPIKNNTSIAQFWRDYNYTNYIDNNIYLTYINNEIYDEKFMIRKKNFINIEHIYLFASNSDEIISPWQSSIFGFYDNDGKTILDMTKQNIFINDLFGLQTLYNNNKLDLIVIDGIKHSDWMYKQDIIEKYILDKLE